VEGEHIVMGSHERDTVPLIDHVQIAVPAGGEEQARRFYGAVLGLKEIEKPANLRKRGGVWFMTGNVHLHLGVDPAFRPAEKAHVAFQVSGLAAIRGRLEAAGYTVAEDEPLPGIDRLYVKDPFGNRMELLEPAEHP
jgi:catechol 2,3-dioxygenase-like lactoylglutathione lyase family enzyme